MESNLNKKYLDFVKGIEPILKEDEIIWFYSKDFKEKQIFNNCEALDRYCKSNYMRAEAEKILYSKGLIIGVTNNIKKIKKTSKIFFDKTINKKEILKYENSLRHVFFEINDFFMPTIKNIKITYEYYEQ